RAVALSFVCPHLSPHHAPPPEIYTLSLHDALPIFGQQILVIDKAHGFYRNRITVGLAIHCHGIPGELFKLGFGGCVRGDRYQQRSEEHTSELQSRENLVCRLLLEKRNYLDWRDATR